MLSQEDNELLTRVGPGTLCGDLLRRYWHPIAASDQLRKNPVRPVKILGEALTLYRDRGGALGLIAARCPHRSLSLGFGIPEQDGLRCPYHGWEFNAGGQCIDQPLEPPGSLFKEKVTITAYPVEELGGLVWAYLGPKPAPLIPRWDLLVRDGVFRQILVTELPCNWLQVMENRLDLAHGTYLHGRFFQYVLERQGRQTDDPRHRSNAQMLDRPIKHATKPYAYGLLKRVVRTGQSEDVPAWQQGVNPIAFPYLLRNGGSKTVRQTFQMGVPLDDTHTLHLSYHGYIPGEGVLVPHQEVVSCAEVPLYDEHGQPILDYVLGQDMAAWYGQGEIVDRSQERLGGTDACIIAYRQMLKEQIQLVQDGQEPMNVFRDPEENVCLEFPLLTEGASTGTPVGNYRANYHRGYDMDDVDRYCPDIEVIRDLMRQAEEVRLAAALQQR